MYVVVGCSSCHAFWVHDGSGETAGCPGCGTRHRLDQVKVFARTETATAARTARGALLAARDGRDPSELPGYTELEDDIADPLVTDRAVLRAHGIDPDRVAAAGDRAMAPRGRVDQQTRIRQTIDAMEQPSVGAVVDALDDIPPKIVEATVDGMLRDGALVRTDEGLRLL